MFRIGQKVVCVNDTPFTPDSHWSFDIPSKGQIYTVAGAGPDYKFRGKYYPIIYLKEITNGHDRADDFGYWTQRFQPVRETKTDISVFTAMLNTKKSKVKA